MTELSLDSLPAEIWPRFCVNPQYAAVLRQVCRKMSKIPANLFEFVSSDAAVYVWRSDYYYLCAVEMCIGDWKGVVQFGVSAATYTKNYRPESVDMPTSVSAQKYVIRMADNLYTTDDAGWLLYLPEARKIIYKYHSSSNGKLKLVDLCTPEMYKADYTGIVIFDEAVQHGGLLISWIMGPFDAAAKFKDCEDRLRIYKLLDI